MESCIEDGGEGPQNRQQIGGRRGSGDVRIGVNEDIEGLRQSTMIPERNPDPLPMVGTFR